MTALLKGYGRGALGKKESCAILDFFWQKSKN